MLEWSTAGRGLNDQTGFRDRDEHQQPVDDLIKEGSGWSPYQSATIAAVFPQTASVEVYLSRLLTGAIDTADPRLYP